MAATKSFTYTLCEMLIKAGRIAGMQNKLDVYLANDRLTAEEYTALCGMIEVK